ncbi:ATP-binding cassette domain-containing protein [uncultured Fretibacterium sp.]|uniref:ATP-binding cassette domain-containing protein n=1 Tax=uncultured Fretibacterium sp. TaxID=1678694 RepID=UPI00260588C6|nr:ATP-binding cassette domain-containing protein [uncultured Fretibacterium sp.]
MSPAEKRPPAERFSGSQVVVEGLVRTFGRRIALDGITARVAGGRITGLVGPDGAGKTTLLRLLCGLLTPTGGRVTVCGYDTAADADAIHERVGYMPQRFGLYEDLTVRENMDLYAELRSVPREERSARYAELLAFTGLGPFTGRLAGRLSGGMKQKLGLACTLLSRPPVLLLDEPGVGVDPLARRELWRMVRELLTPDRIVVWSTAYLDEAEACDTVLLLNEGRLLYDGTPKDLAKRVEGRVFLLGGAGGRRRKLIAPLMERKGTLDAVIQGSSVRVLTSDDGTELRGGLDALSREAEVFVEVEAEPSSRLALRPTPPRFEDAFMQLLGGARRGSGAVAEFFGEKGTGGVSVEARHLTKRFGSFTAVDDVSFSIGQGEIFGLLGPNGAGKSTTFKMMCGLLTPTEGGCAVSGLDFRTAPGAARAKLGYMAQKFSLYGDLTVLQNLRFFSGIYGLRDGAAVERVVETFDLGPYLSSRAGSLPLGFKQRLAMGCAVMHGPDVLFLDEPTSGVDPVTRREFWTCINSFALKGVTVMVTTHFMDEAEYCDRIALVYRGRTIASGPPDALKASVRTDERPDPTLEEAFIALIERQDAAGAAIPKP